MALPPLNSPICQATDCGDKWKVWIPNLLTPTICEAVFGDPHPGDMLAVCQPHYRFLKRVDGIDLGWKTINGKTTAYVKNWSF